MNIIRKPCPNFYPKRNGITPVGICNHISQGTLSSMDAWFNNRASNASSHFGIGRDGTIHQFVSIEDGAWTQGIGRDAIPYATAPLIKQMNMNPNYYLVSIEHEGYEGNGLDGNLTEQQFLSTLMVHKYIQDYVINKYGQKIGLNPYYVLGHYQIDPRRKPYCPGRNFPWARLYKELAIADVLTLEAYEEHLHFKSTAAYDSAEAFKFANRILDLQRKLNGSKWSAEASRKVLKLAPVAAELGFADGEEVTAEQITKRIIERYTASSAAKFEDESFPSLMAVVQYGKTVGLL